MDSLWNKENMEEDILLPLEEEMEDDTKFMCFCRLCLQYHENSKVNIFADQNDEEGNTKPAINELLYDLFRIEYLKEKTLPVSICDTCQQAITFITKFRQLIVDSEIFLRHYIQVVKNGESIQPGLNGCPGEFQPPENCVITVINPEEATLTSNDEFSSDDSGDENDKTSSIQCNAFIENKQLAQNNMMDGANINDSNIAISVPEETNLESDSPNGNLVEQETINSITEISTVSNNNFTTNEINHLPTSVKVKKQKFLCQFCDMAFRNSELCYEHEIEHGVHQPYICFVCHLHFNDIQIMVKHIKTNHDAQRPFFCVICGKNFSQRAGLKKHVVVHLDAERFLCTHCGKDFSRNSNLLKHLQVHKSAQQLNHTNEIEEGLQVHGTTDTGITVAKIQTTSKSTASSWSLPTPSQHRLHTCEICAKTFTREKDLSRHKAIHLDTLFNCKICGERFNRQEKLVRHEKDAHKPMQKNSCTKCAAEFDDVLDLQRHEATTHNHGSLLWKDSPTYSPQIAMAAGQNHSTSNVHDKSHYSLTAKQFRSRSSSIQDNGRHHNKSLSAINLGFYSETNTNDQGH